ncbi:MAG: hypothetical protein IJK91_07225 [Bacteroidales bacterium]|nr:hypothetical protein [Bacteroidales bacterium]
MKRVRIIIAAAVMLLCPLLSRAQERPTFIPKGEFAVGIQFGTLDLNSDNSGIMLVLNPITAKGRVSMIAPFVEYAYKNDRVAGARISYTSGNASVDNITIDLLNEGMAFDFSDVSAGITMLSATLFHRNYFALDPKSRVAVVAEFALSGGRGHSEFNTGGEAMTRADYLNAKLSFSPGLSFFVMNNISITATLSMANLSYNRVECFNNNEPTGSRDKFGANVGLDLLGTWFGVAFHF